MMTLFAVSLAAAMIASGGVNQSRIDDVKSGKLTEARASWWGFDPEDSTSSIQSAINSGAKRVIIENMGQPWIVTPLVAASDQELVFEQGAVLQAKKGEFKGTNDSLLSVVNKRSVTITGNGATWRMHRDDYAKPPYKKAEWRHTLQIKSSSNVKVSGLTMAESGGDGIYLGVATRGVTNKNVHIQDVVLEKHYRQGISVITAEDLLIENTIMRTTAGTAPMAGIDFEPNHFSERLVNCVLRNCVVENNQGVGYAFYLPNMTAQSEPISIRLENCVARGSNRLPLVFTNGEGEGQGPLTGTVEFNACNFSGGNSPAVTLNRKPAKGAKLRFVNCQLKPGEGEPNTPAILFSSSAGNQEDVGGVHFENCVIDDPQRRPVMGFHDGAGGLRLIDVTGSLETRAGDTTSHLEITPDWLDKLHRGNTFKRFPKYETANTQFIPLQPTEADQKFPQRPFSQRKWGTYILFADRGINVTLTLKHMQVGRYSGQPIVVNAVTPSGKQLNLGAVPFQAAASLSFIAPETGLYRIPIQSGPNKFQLDSTNCPTVISGEAARVWFISSVGDLYFYVPAGTKEFGVKVFGEGMEGVGAAILNADGTKLWEQPTITMPEQYVGAPESEQGEIWTLRISRPATGAMEDYYVELQGIPPFLATNSSSLLRPTQ
ncbi:MAG: right-handed parallel beta-helix repeat-containing protein [Planctomycetaceae bacterium]|nr:right-handed parallel beta-helix repeat-containing protein [Planctomycetaceae bacterium]